MKKTEGIVEVYMKSSVEKDIILVNFYKCYFLFSIVSFLDCPVKFSQAFLKSNC